MQLLRWTYKRTFKVAKGKTTYYWRCISRIEHGSSYCKDSVGIEERVLHAAICRCLAKMMENDQEVLTLIQSNLSYAIPVMMMFLMYLQLKGRSVS